MNELNRIPQTRVAADTVGDLMNSLRGNQTDVPSFNPGPAVCSPDPKVIPKTNVAVDDPRQKAALKRLRDAMRADKPMVIHPDGTLGVLDSKKAEPDMKTIPKTHVAADTVGDLMNSLRGNQADGPSFDPGAAAQTPDPKVIPKTNVAAPQWYQTNPALYQAEIAAMRKELNNPTLQPRFMADGRMYWLVKCRPNIGPEFRTQEYTLALIYDADHPSCRYGSSIKVYIVDPTMRQLQEWVNKIPGLSPRTIPRTLKDKDGFLYLCSVNSSDTSSNLSTGATSAVTSFRYAYRYLNILEGGVRDPEGLWKDFHQHGVV